ncbi:MAG: hypothetical protein IPK48_13385 [Gammaproteobacteria bacterium]|nr:hypothetical protein [Gammaproteobacteria bacterium]
MINSAQRFLLYAAYGRAILLTHVIEQRVAFQVALWDMLKSGSNDEIFREKYLSLQKSPFGRLINIGISNGTFSEEDREALNQYRKLRNVLVHDISASISFRLFTKIDSDNVIAELNQIAIYFHGMSEELMKSIQFLCQASGVDFEDVDQKMATLIEKLSNMDLLIMPNNDFEKDSSR